MYIGVAELETSVSGFDVATTVGAHMADRYMALWLP